MDELMHQTMNEEQLQLYIRFEPLITGVFSNYPMPKMMGLMEKILGHPAMIIDMGFKIIDETPSITDDFRLHVRNTVFLVESCIDLIKASPIFKNVQNRSYSSVLILHPAFQNFITASIRVTGMDVMMLVVFENGVSFDTSDYDRIKMASRLLAVQYQKADTVIARSRMMLPNHILFSLINGERVTREELTARIDYVPWVSHKRLYFLLIDAKDDQTDIQPRFLSILPALRMFLPEEYCLTYRSLIISFLGVKQFEDLYVKHRRSFEDFLNAHHLCCAISAEYSDILDSRAYYLSARNMLRVARRYRLALAYFPDMHFYILHDLISARYSPANFYHPIIKKLADYDAENASNLLETLDVYLSNKSDPDLAAERLFLHRSTLFYRIKKIRELTGYRLENMDELARIYDSLRLYEIDRQSVCETTV